MGLPWLPAEHVFSANTPSLPPSALASVVHALSDSLTAHTTEEPGTYWLLPRNVGRKGALISKRGQLELDWPEMLTRSAHRMQEDHECGWAQ